MRLLRRNAPSVPASLHRSASARSARFSPAENWRRLAIATTSGSGGAALLGIPSLALRAPSGTPRTEVEESLTIEDFITADMSGYYLWTLNYRRQMSHCTLAQGGVKAQRRRVFARYADVARKVLSPASSRIP